MQETVPGHSDWYVFCVFWSFLQFCSLEQGLQSRFPDESLEITCCGVALAVVWLAAEQLHWRVPASPHTLLGQTDVQIHLLKQAEDTLEPRPPVFLVVGKQGGKTSTSA